MKRIAVGIEQAAFAAGQILAAIEAERRHVAKGAGLLALIQRSVRLTRVFDHRQFVFFGNGVDFVHIRRLPVEMHRDNGLRAFRNLALNLGGIDAKSVGIDVHEYGDSVLLQDRQGAGDERQGGCDHLIAGTDAGRGHRDVQRRRSAIGGDAMLRSHVVGPFVLETLDLPRKRPPEYPAVQHIFYRRPVGIGHRWARQRGVL